MTKKINLGIISGLIFGIVLGTFIIAISFNIAGEKLILKEMKSPYNDVNKTVEVIKNRINSTKGWHVIQIYDYNDEIVKNGGKPIGKMKLIKFCSAKHASEMLAIDKYKKIAAMLPKTLAIYEKSDGQVYVAAGNGAIMGKLFTGKAAKIAEKVSYEIESIMRFMNFKFTTIF